MPRSAKTILLVSVFLILFSTILSAEEITITTYYPSPYGVYRELRSQRMAIGEDYIKGDDYTWDTFVGDTQEVDFNADLVVQGNVGIGTTNPQFAQVQIENIGTPLAFRETDTSGKGSLWRMDLDGKEIRFDSSNDGVTFGSPSSPAYTWALVLRSNGDAMLNGNVGIGTTAPAEKLEVNGNIKLSGATATYKITNLAAPTANNDAANKAYVDAQAGGSAFGISCGWITTGNPPAVGSCNPGGCPAGYTSSNVGCEVTSIASGGMMAHGTGTGSTGEGAPSFGTLSSAVTYRSPAGAAGKCQRVCFK